MVLRHSYRNNTYKANALILQLNVLKYLCKSEKCLLFLINMMKFVNIHLIDVYMCNKYFLSAVCATANEKGEGKQMCNITILSQTQ